MDKNWDKCNKKDMKRKKEKFLVSILFFIFFCYGVYLTIVNSYADEYSSPSQTSILQYTSVAVST